VLANRIAEARRRHRSRFCVSRKSGSRWRCCRAPTTSRSTGPGSHRRHGNARDGRQLRHRRAPRRILSGPEGRWLGRCDRNRNAQPARRCITSNGCGCCTRKRCRCSTRPRRARSRWSPVPVLPRWPGSQRYIVRAVNARVRRRVPLRALELSSRFVSVAIRGRQGDVIVSRESSHVR
jgi:hypothetical protein